MGIIAICLVSIKGEIGCVVKNSFVSYQRIAAIIESFKSTIEDIRISCKSGNNNSLGGKRIEDMYPISQPIPLVVGSYRLLYQLINDMYVIAIDLDHHSPFLALDVINKVKEVIFATMKGNVSFARIVEFKIKYYYSFRRCINGMEGVSTIDVPLRQIRLANDPLVRYTNENTLVDINDVLRPGEFSSEVRDYTRDSWEAILHFESRIPADIKKEIKAGMKKRKLDEFFDITTELDGHVLPETVTTPMADLIVDEEYDAEEVLKPLTAIQSALNQVPKYVTTFSVNPTVPIASASNAICEPFTDLVSPVAVSATGDKIEEEEDVDEEIKVDAGKTIQVDVPGKTPADVPGKTQVATDVAVATEEDAADEEVEELNVIELDGAVTETLKLEQNSEGEMVKHVFKGDLTIKPIIPGGIPEGNTSARVTIKNTAGLTFKCDEGLCKIVEDNENDKTFEISLPTVNKEEGTHVLTYLGTIPEDHIPCTAEALSSRDDTVTSAKVTAHCNECPNSANYIEDLTVLLSPPLLSTDPALKRAIKSKPKGGFLKTSQKMRYTDQAMEGGNDYSFGAEITEPVELGSNPSHRDPEYCPCELKGKYNGIASGISVIVNNTEDKTLHCSYVKREFLATCKFTLNFNP